MGFLKRLFGNNQPKEYVDKNGIYFHVACTKCESQMRLRADRQYELNSTGSGYEWKKTFVCDKCFQKMPTTVMFDGKYNIINQDIAGGKYVSESEHEAWKLEQAKDETPEAEE